VPGEQAIPRPACGGDLRCRALDATLVRLGDTLKAIIHERYGPPDFLELREVDKPVVGDDQVLVRVRATSVNPVDWHTMTGTPYMVRMMAGLLKPKSEFLGVDFAGTVEAVGRGRHAVSAR
jgi:NADPH:quinone reductase-like Zn-dependent oxidoreductase